MREEHYAEQTSLLVQKPSPFTTYHIIEVTYQPFLFVK